MRIAAVQHDIVWEDRDGDFARPSARWSPGAAAPAPSWWC